MERATNSDLWQPNSEVLHSGKPIRSEMRFVIAPPHEIGDVITCESTIGVYRESTPKIRLLRSGVAFGLVVLASSILYVLFVPTHAWMENILPSMLTMVILGVLVATIAFFVCKNDLRISFVGIRGIARYKFKNSDQPPNREEIFLFEDADALRTKLTREYQNGIYVASNYQFQWVDEVDKTQFKLAGSFSAGKDNLPVGWDSEYFLALSAEDAFNRSKMEKIETEFMQSGFVKFRIDKNRFISVGTNFLEFDFNGKVERVSSSEIKNISVKEGWFKIQTINAKLLSFKGKYSFAYGEMANPTIFLSALQEIAGFEYLEE